MNRMQYNYNIGEMKVRRLIKRGKKDIQIFDILKRYPKCYVEDWIRNGRTYYKSVRA